MDAKPPESANTEYVCKLDKDLQARLDKLEKIQIKPLSGTTISYNQVKDMTLVGSWSKSSETQFASPLKSIAYSKMGSKLNFSIFKDGNGVAQDKRTSLKQLLKAESHKLSSTELALVQSMVRGSKIQSGKTQLLSFRKVIIAEAKEKDSKSVHLISVDLSGTMPYQTMSLSGPTSEVDKYLPDFRASINSIQWSVFSDEWSY